MADDIVAALRSDAWYICDEVSYDEAERRDRMAAAADEIEDLRARLAAVEAFCRDYPRSAKYPDYEGGYESALDDVLEVIAARGEETR